MYEVSLFIGEGEGYILQNRYKKNQKTISETEQDILLQKKVAIIGCGGLGQHSAAQLCRIGVGQLTIIDPDTFDTTNLNRQLFSNTENIGIPKVLETQKLLQIINPDVKIVIYQERFNTICSRFDQDTPDLFIEGLDSKADRITLQQVCKDLNKPLISAAIAGWYGLLTLIKPGDDTLNHIYKENNSVGMEAILGNPSFTPALVASLQVAEAIKYLLGKPTLQSGEILYIDLLNMEFKKLK